MIGLLAAIVVLASPQAPPRPQWTKGSDVVMNSTIEDKVVAIARRYHKKGRRPLHVTSGVRPPPRQAAAMYGKLRAGGSLGIYAQQELIKPIRDAYRLGRKKRWSKARTIAAMTEVIEGQVSRGHLLSRHLSGRAFDLRSVGLGRRDKRALIAAIRGVDGLRVNEESRPPHFHLEVTD